MTKPTFIEVTPLEPPFRERFHVIQFAGNEKLLAVSHSDYLKLSDLLGGEAGFADRFVELSQGPKPKIRITRLDQ